MRTAKDRARERMWALLDAAGAIEDGGSAHGTIPRFRGAQQAADRLAALPQWHRAAVVKAVPDHAQLPVRARALAEGRTVYMAAPRLAAPRPFYILDPAEMTLPPEQAARARHAAHWADTADTDALQPVDLLVCGSVAVDRDGTRLGKGAGYSDIEFALLADAGLIGPHTLIATTVHTLQVVDDPLPREPHDYGVDVILTPDATIACTPAPRPTGLDWTRLPADKIAAIPALAARAQEHRR